MRWLALAGCLLLLGCGSGKPFLGTWKTSDGAMMMIFNSDGTMTFSAGQLGSKSGRWKDAGDGVLEVQAEGAPTPGRTQWKVGQDGKSLVLTDLNAPPGQPASITYLRQ